MKTIFKPLLGALLVLAAINVKSQNVGVNSTGANPNSSAMLDVSSTESGMLVPRMTESQKDGIGTPATGLLIYQTNNTPGFYYYNGTAWVPLQSGWDLTGNAGTNSTVNFLGTTDNEHLRIRTNNTQRMIITDDGNVGVNGWGFTPLSVSGPNDGSSIFSIRDDIVYGDRFHIDMNAGGAGIDIETSSGPLNIINSYAVNGSQDDIRFFTTPDLGTPIERMRIDQDGGVGIGLVVPTEQLDVNGNARFRAVGSGAFSSSLNLTSNGTLTTNSSDRRLKTDITPLSGSLSKLLMLNGVSFKWKEHMDAPQKDFGFIAQDVEPIFPEVVFTNKVDGYKGINYDRFIAVLTEAIKEQQQIIESQKGEIKNHKQEIRALKVENSKQKEAISTQNNEMKIVNNRLELLEQHLNTVNK